MDFGGAPNTDAAASLPGNVSARLRRLGRQVDDFLEAERGQLPLWAVIAFASGIGCWFWMDAKPQWIAAICLGLALSSAGAAGRGRAGRTMLWAGLLFAAGIAFVWWRSELVAAPRLERVTLATFEARVEKVEPLIAKGRVRLTLATSGPALPPRVRVSLREAQWDARMGEGSRLAMRARLMPPPKASLPGAYDFSRRAWFSGIGAVGTALGEVTVIAPSSGDSLDAVRASLGAHVLERLPGVGDGVATALVTGDQFAVAPDAADAMRRSGLAHLLSVSGLHISAVVGAAILLSLRLMALSPWLALRVNLVTVAAGVGALAGIGYTLLTGMQVPTVRSCIAALLVLGGLALGREAISLRLVATGALIVLLVRPDAIVGASFQMSFAAVSAIIALHGQPRVRRWLARREEGWGARIARGLIGLALTGLAVEVTLIPIALYHFHKSGLYGVLANMVAIPLTTFVTMPMLALALFADLVGLGAPLWWIAGVSLDLMIAMAMAVAEAKGAVTMVPAMPTVAFALSLIGGLWLFAWRSRVRLLGLAPLLCGLAIGFTRPAPDLLVTGDGRHLAIVEDGTPFVLRARSGDFVREMLAEAAGFDGEMAPLDAARQARCSRDACTARIGEGAEAIDLLAIRSRDYMRWDALVAACARSDIVVADRRLPQGCTPRWLRLDRGALERSGGIALWTGPPVRLRQVAGASDHPWDARPRPPVL